MNNMLLITTNAHTHKLALEVELDVSTDRKSVV